MLRTAVVSSPFRRITVVGLALVMITLGSLFALRPHAAKAGLAWCASDPVISVNGKLISVTINIPAERVRDVEKAQVVFHVPVNVDARVVFVDQRWFPETARIVKDQPYWDGNRSLKVPVEVFVESEARYPFAIGIAVADQASAYTWYDAITDKTFTFDTYGFVAKR